ncbi:hypothetical protein [Arachidicoccus soli]|uniref:Deoxyuridine 5'-triphosphate nucleotidohydrolase n=1 Tax=Arachidicoccus soli TaxID=2341117 RepID=A0A386HSF6_9BACT|nr:hypothetical protein [Arachidicoccus soli]AYD48805.1 hypothetical protein D6B99_15030 [Arachidicoccus soli]
MILSNELKDAVSKLSSKEKDKLIFRLLKKDTILTKRLLFELVNGTTVEEERENILKKLASAISQSTRFYYSPGELLMEVRSMSGLITEHVAITKDKYGDSWLNLFMLNKVIEVYNNKILSTNYYSVEKFCISVIARVFKIMLSIIKLHEDFLIEFRVDLEKLGTQIGENQYLMQTAIRHGLDVNWLISGNIPEDIAAIYKQIRQEGFLR